MAARVSPPAASRPPISPGIGRAPGAVAAGGSRACTAGGEGRPISPGIGRAPAVPAPGALAPGAAVAGALAATASRVLATISPTTSREVGDGIAAVIRSHWLAKTSTEGGGVSWPMA